MQNCNKMIGEQTRFILDNCRSGGNHRTKTAPIRPAPTAPNHGSSSPASSAHVDFGCGPRNRFPHGRHHQRSHCVVANAEGRRWFPEWKTSERIFSSGQASDCSRWYSWLDGSPGVKLIKLYFFVNDAAKNAGFVFASLFKVWNNMVPHYKDSPGACIIKILGA
jgi:hypothetical protein